MTSTHADKRRKQGNQDVWSRDKHPNKWEWEKHKSTITELYRPGSGWTLQRIQNFMGENYGFWATLAMYKRHLNVWGLRRNKTKSVAPPIHLTSSSSSSCEFLSALSRPEARSNMICPASHDRSGSYQMSLTSQDLLRLHLRLQKSASHQSHQSLSSTSNVRPDAPICISAQLIPFKAFLSTSEGVSRTNSQNSFILTPDASSNSSAIRMDLPSVDYGHNISAEGDQFQHVASTGKAEQLNQQGLESELDSQLFAIQQAGSQLEFPSAPASTLPMQRWRADSRNKFKHLKSRSRRNQNSHGGIVPETLYIPRFPATEANPETFVGFCLQSCTLHSQARYEDADQVANQASEAYSYLIAQDHRHALTSLDAVVSILLEYGAQMQTVALLEGVKRVAEEKLGKMHPLVHTIAYKTFQGLGEYLGIHADGLKEVYESFCAMLSRQHPHSLVAGYLYAWRLSVGGTGEAHQWHALGLLSELQSDSDKTLGEFHFQSMALLMTKARVLHSRQLYHDALTVLSEAKRRIEFAYPLLHPYLLSCRSWYASLLFYLERDDEAGSEWIAAALGKVEWLGREHQLSQEAIQDVEKFFCKTEQQSRAEDFRVCLSQAEHRHSSGRSQPLFPFIC